MEAPEAGHHEKDRLYCRIRNYTRDLIQALAEHGHRHDYVVLVTGNTDAWTLLVDALEEVYAKTSRQSR